MTILERMIVWGLRDVGFKRSCAVIGVSFPNYTIRKIRSDAGFKKPTKQERKLHREDS